MASTVFVKVDGDQAREVLQANGVSAFPTFKVLPHLAGHFLRRCSCASSSLHLKAEQALNLLVSFLSFTRASFPVSVCPSVCLPPPPPRRCCRRHFYDWQVFKGSEEVLSQGGFSKAKIASAMETAGAKKVGAKTEKSS